jgi:hypothetical protein
MASFTFGDPGIAVDNQNSIGGSVLDFANLGVNAFLANQAITNQRGASVQVLPNGQIVATGGGAPIPSSLFGGSNTALGVSVGWLLVIGIVLVVLLFKK